MFGVKMFVAEMFGGKLKMHSAYMVGGKMFGCA